VAGVNGCAPLAGQRGQQRQLVIARSPDRQVHIIV